MKIEDFFCIEELISETVFNKYFQDSWQFIDADLLKCLLIIRVGLSSSITINNWKSGGKFSQRGLRENNCPMVAKKTKEGKLYLSAHTMGKALDFDVKGYTATEVREWIVDNAEKFPCKIRLENELNGKPISWIHLDVFQNKKNPKVYLFNI
tara:strand:+ start:25 stop:480 length:456 start_codon:yes stop_codon:yes gene_type:complete